MTISAVQNHPMAAGFNNVSVSIQHCILFMANVLFRFSISFDGETTNSSIFMCALQIQVV